MFLRFLTLKLGEGYRELTKVIKSQQDSALVHGVVVIVATTPSVYDNDILSPVR